MLLLANTLYGCLFKTSNQIENGAVDFVTQPFPISPERVSVPWTSPISCLRVRETSSNEEGGLGVCTVPRNANPNQAPIATE